MLKQPQFAPLDAAIQVFVLYAATRGLLDEMDLSLVSDWENSLKSYLLTEKSDLLDKVREGAKLKDVEDEIKKVLELQQERFKN